MGTTQLGSEATPFSRLSLRNGQPDSAFDGAVNPTGNVLGSYIHGLFDSAPFCQALLNQLRQRKGLPVYDGPAFDYADYKQQQFDLLADKMREHIDMDKIYRLMTEHQQTVAQ
jgi:adenosylcobyric acid synthase